MIRVMVKEPYEAPYVTEIDNELEELQRIVGGYIECVPFPGVPDAVLICNEEGKLKELTPNIFFGSDVIRGTLIVAGIAGEGLPEWRESDIWLSLTIRALHRPEYVDRATGYK